MKHGSCSSQSECRDGPPPLSPSQIFMGNETYSPAEFEEDLLKDQNWTGAAQDGERLASKQRVGHARHRRPKQRLYGALWVNEWVSEWGRNFHSWFFPSRFVIVVLSLCFLWWLLPAALRMWWPGTCRRSRGRGQTLNTVGWWHLWGHSTGTAPSSGRHSPNHQRAWQTEGGVSSESTCSESPRETLSEKQLMCQKLEISSEPWIHSVDSALLETEWKSLVNS